MLKKLLSLMLILLSSGALAVESVYGKNHKSQEPAKIKKEISKLGVDAPVIVKLSDGRKLSGRIGEIDDDSFVVRVGGKGDSTVITYSEVKQVKYDGSSGGANLLPGFLIAGVVILLIKLIH